MIHFFFLICRSNTRIDDGEWHTIHARRRKRVGFISVDDHPPTRGILRNGGIALRTSAKLWIGNTLISFNFTSLFHRNRKYSFVLHRLWKFVKYFLIAGFKYTFRYYTFSISNFEENLVLIRIWSWNNWWPVVRWLFQQSLKKIHFSCKFEVRTVCSSENRSFLETSGTRGVE